MLLRGALEIEIELRRYFFHMAMILNIFFYRICGTIGDFCAYKTPALAEFTASQFPFHSWISLEHLLRTNTIQNHYHLPNRILGSYFDKHFKMFTRYIHLNKFKTPCTKSFLRQLTSILSYLMHRKVYTVIRCPRNMICL